MIWQVRTAGMFIVMSLIMAALGLVVGLYFGNIMLGLGVLLVIAVIFNLYSYFFSKNRALKANGVRIVTAVEEPRLYAIVKSVAERANVPMPEVGVSDAPMPNAFATGRNPKNAAVVATRGLLNMLPDDQLEGVIAHEMAHVKNRDILVMSIASTMASILTYLARFIFYSAILNSNNKNPWMLVIGVVAAITVPIASILVQLGVSRNREFLADETGAKITGNPMALANALRSIERGVASPKNEYDNSNYASMWISNPLRKKGVFSKLFSTHPPMDERIARLTTLASKMNGGRAPEPTEDRPGRRSASDY